MNYRKIVLLTVLSLLISANSSCNSQILSIGQGFNPTVKDKGQVFFEQIGHDSPYTDRIIKNMQNNHVYLEVDSLAKYKLPYFNYLINDQFNETLQSNNILQPEIDIFNSFIKDTNTHFLYYVDEDCFFRDMKWDTYF